MRTASLSAAALALTLASSPSDAADWTYALGVHNMVVRDVASTTWGLTGHAAVDDVTAKDIHRFASFDVYLDHDEDHLDPDHIPVWWQTDLGVDAKFFQGDRKMFVGWAVTQDTRM